MLRKHVYGGIPPTDPRVQNMTIEQIDMEFLHMQQDKKVKDKLAGQSYEDEAFDEWDKESEEEDRGEPASEDVLKKPYDPDDWEDDDDEDDEPEI